MTGEQKKRLSELAAGQKVSKAARKMEQMRAEIPDFERKYVFADHEQVNRLDAFCKDIPFCRPGWVDVQKFTRCREFSPNEADDNSRRIWICFLMGTKELFDIYVGGTLGDYFSDFPEWDFYSPFILLIFDDMSGFIFIDDNGDMTEVII